MRRNYDIALKNVLVHEGGYVNHPKDPGGATNKGITQRTYNAYRAVKYPEAPPISVEFIEDVEVGEIYRDQYAAPIWFDRLPSGLDYALFDFAVNSGVSRAVKFVQRIVGASPDGIMGNQTLRAINDHNIAVVIRELCAARRKFVRGLKTYSTFGRGWEKRIDAVERDAMSMDTGYHLLPTDVGDQGAQAATGGQTVAGSVSQSRRSKAAAVGTAGVVLSTIPEAIELAQPAKDAFAVGKYATVIGLIITAVALAYIIYVRTKDD